MKRHEYPCNYIPRTTEQIPILYPHLDYFALARMKLQQQQQQVTRPRRAPALAARARRCAFPGGQPREAATGPSTPADRGLRPQIVPQHGWERAQRPPCAGGPRPDKKAKGTMGQMADSELKPLRELRSNRRRGSRGEAEKNLGAITRALGHSEISDSRASAGRSA